MKTPIAPHLLEELHPTLSPNAVALSAWSRKKVWWLGKCGHEWDARVNDRSSGQGCPVCSGRRVVVGVNDLSTVAPTVAAQWSWEKNVSLTPETVTAQSSRKVWWLGECGHEWEGIISHRVNGSGCPFCSGRVPVAGVNDLFSTYPELREEWHSERNSQIDPTHLMRGSSRKVWWLGKCGHEWEASPSKRVSGRGCPVCAGHQIVVGVNDFASFHPTLALEWNASKNTLLPNEVTAGSGLKVWWLGTCGHEWEARIVDRVSLDHGCPVCLNRKVVVGKNDLGSTHPALIQEWDMERNANITYYDVSSGSVLKVHWKCSQGHAWEAQVRARSQGSGCPQCWAKTFISQGEQELADTLRNLGVQVQQSVRGVLPGGLELDLFLPELQIGVEFNGLYWHSDAVAPDRARLRHYEKWMAATSVGIQLIQIWEDDWLRRKDVIIRLLAHKCGVSDKLPSLDGRFAESSEKIFARKTSASSLSTDEARFFLNANHVQGFASGSHYLGLKDAQGVIRAVFVAKKESGDVLSIIRYATSGSVVGGFTKLLAYAEKNYQPKSFITFADHTVSDGGLYENNGFVADKELRPDYMYVVKGERKHKFGYRLKRFKDDPTLQYGEGFTERELAQLNNLPRIWDAGKTRYRKFV